MSNLKYLYYWY